MRLSFSLLMRQRNWLHRNNRQSQRRLTNWKSGMQNSTSHSPDQVRERFEPTADQVETRIAVECTVMAVTANASTTMRHSATFESRNASPRLTAEAKRSKSSLSTKPDFTKWLAALAKRGPRTVSAASSKGSARRNLACTAKSPQKGTATCCPVAFPCKAAMINNGSHVTQIDR